MGPRNRQRILGEMVMMGIFSYLRRREQELNKKLEIAEKALQFYADHKNWKTGSFSTPWTENLSITSDDLVFWKEEDFPHAHLRGVRLYTGGKMATEALKIIQRGKNDQQEH